jgi:hypothetical protein
LVIIVVGTLAGLLRMLAAFAAALAVVVIIAVAVGR